LGVIQIENVLINRGSKYAVSGDMVTDRKQVEAFITASKWRKKFVKARLWTHNQNNTVAARAMADMKIKGHLS